ncbi:hypothetical protein LCGC14_1780190 [marine sediment metagenome]|uniref:Uncharacterized protein n=1 Tax=marine sediment metagenome TaxID=412755 RepID=A0A0F9JVA4_9ZZZZ
MTGEEYELELQQIGEAWPQSRASDLRAHCDGVDNYRDVVHVPMAALKELIGSRVVPDGHENVTTDLSDDEIDLIVKGLWAIDSDEPGVPELVEKLGFKS